MDESSTAKLKRPSKLRFLVWCIQTGFCLLVPYLCVFTNFFKGSDLSFISIPIIPLLLKWPFPRNPNDPPPLPNKKVSSEVVGISLLVVVGLCMALTFDFADTMKFFSKVFPFGLLLAWFMIIHEGWKRFDRETKFSNSATTGKRLA